MLILISLLKVKHSDTGLQCVWPDILLSFVTYFLLLFFYKILLPFCTVIPSDLVTWQHKQCKLMVRAQLKGNAVVAAIR